MMILGIIILAIAAILTWLIFVPVVLTVDSTEGKYEISQRASFKLVFNTRDINHISLHLFGLKGLSIDVTGGSGKPHPAKSKHRRRKNTKSIEAWRCLAKDIIRSLTIEEFKMNLDTGDYVLNAQLTPIGLLCSHGPVMIRTNFLGLNNVFARIELRVHLLISAFILFTFKK